MTKGVLSKMQAYLKSNPRTGMSLIEVVLAIAVAGFVLTAATSFVVSVSSIWGTRAERHFFEDHVDGVMQFLHTSFDRAGIAISTDTPNGENSEDAATPNEGTPEIDVPTIEIPDESIEVDIRNGEGESQGEARNSSDEGVSLILAEEDAIGWKRPPGTSSYEDPLLSFELNALPPLLNAPAELPQFGGVRVYLHFDDNHGLRLLWHPLLQETIEDTNDLRSTQISGLVEAIEYIYWDERLEEWEIETEPLKGDGQDQFLLPRYLRLTFVHDSVRDIRNLAVPIPSRSVFLF